MRGKNKKRNSISCVKLFSKQQMNEWMNDRPTDRLTDRPTDQMNEWITDWLTDWLNFIQVSEYLAIKLKGDTKDDIQNEK